GGFFLRTWVFVCEPYFQGSEFEVVPEGDAIQTNVHAYG
ncbi:MAG: hypothetical protein ACI974_001308, partial [Paraglaciecola sp.]